MLKQFFTKLSQNYIEILKDDEYYDVTIEVGEDPNVKIFHAHAIILRYRSPFLRRTLDSNKKNNYGVLAHIRLSNILPETFQNILDYIYGGTILLNEQNVLEILKLLAAADILHLHELVDCLQKYLIENEHKWIEQYFGLACRTSFQSDSLLNLQQFCTNFVAKFPEKIFKSSDFTSLSEKSLISLIKRDDLQMDEVEVLEHVLKWGLEKNPTLILDPLTWSDDDFKMMENTLQNCLPFVRFFSISSEDFFQKVRPYQKLLKRQLYEELLESYLNPNSEPSSDILLPRYRNIDQTFDTAIINLNIVSIISRWVDKIDIKSKYVYARELYLPYEFKLLLRGSRHGLTPNAFHMLCDNIPNTVTLIKVKGTGEIIGGYNPSIWKKSLSVTNYDSIANQIMPDLGQEIEDFKYNTWQITNWSKLERKVTGPEFEAGGFKWHILLYPSGNKKTDDHVSIYLEYADRKSAPSSWHSCAQFAVFLWNPKDPTQYVVHQTHYRFTAKDPAWGSTKFYELHKLSIPSENRTRPLIENDSINITTFIRVFKDPTGVLWADNIPKIKKKKIIHQLCKTKDSFIFSFKDKNNFKNPVLSHVKNIDEALIYCSGTGSAFNSDLSLGVKEGIGSREYNNCYCIQQGYEKAIRDTKDEFLIEDYEVFQLVKKEG